MRSVLSCRCPVAERLPIAADELEPEVPQRAIQQPLDPLGDGVHRGWHRRERTEMLRGPPAPRLGPMRMRVRAAVAVLVGIVVAALLVGCGGGGSSSSSASSRAAAAAAPAAASPRRRRQVLDRRRRERAAHAARGNRRRDVRRPCGRRRGQPRAAARLGGRQRRRVAARFGRLVDRAARIGTSPRSRPPSARSSPTSGACRRDSARLTGSSPRRRCGV